MVKLGGHPHEMPMIVGGEISGDAATVCVSIVSHGHGAMVERLVTALLDCPEVGQIILTLNVPENLVVPEDARISLIHNTTRKGFGANHNSAFVSCTQPFFCPMNPDIELPANPFPGLMRCAWDTGAELVAPLVISPQGVVEDSVRRFPTVYSLLFKAFGFADGRYAVVEGGAEFFPEWVAGMFMLFRSKAFASLGGFDENYFLYYEDVDICVRAWRHGFRVVTFPRVKVIHDARRDSRRSVRHMRWHIESMVRYFYKFWGRLPEVPKAMPR